MKYIYYCLVLLLFASCVQNRKVVLMQKADLNKENLPKDSLMREYGLKKFNYKVQTNDIISVRYQSLTPREFNFFAEIQGTANLNVQGNALVIGELVDEEGKIPMPVVGKVKVAGLTVFQIQDTLQIIANRYLESPIVKVRLLNFRMTFLGEMGHEGVVTFTNNRVTMLEAIGHAGGFGELADRENVKLIRQVGGQTKIYYLNFLKEDFMTSPYFYANQNDILIVPPLKQRTFRKYFAPNFAVVLSTLSIALIVYNITKN